MQAAYPIVVGVISGAILGGCIADEKVDGSAISSGTSVVLSNQTRQELHHRAVALLTQGVESSDAMLRANSIEALEASPSDLEGAAGMGLVDGNRGVRFVAAMAVGRQRLCSIAHLVEPLTNDSSQSVQAAAMFAQHSCGKKVDLSALATMLESPDPEVRGNAALVLGELGNPSAAPLVRQALRAPMPRTSVLRAKVVELQLAETLVRLGQDEEIEAIRAALLLPGDQNEIVALACQIVGRLQDEGSRSYLIGLLDPSNTKKRPIEVQLAAVAALGRLGNPPRVIWTVVQAGLDDANPFVRAQAATTTGTLGGDGALELLSRYLGDPNPLVQISAARGILDIIRATQPL